MIIFSVFFFLATALHKAAFNNAAKAIAALLAKQAPIEARDCNDMTPLHIAAHAGHIAACTSLLAHGSKVTAQASDGASPLHLASSRGHLACCELLIKSGAVVDANDFKGRSLPIDENIDRTDTAADADDADDANAYARKCATPLHLAAWSLFPKVVDLLLKKGANATRQW